ncbi:LTA synthase family protein [Echinicola rosea]|uniref:LTA synthase family protein n=1 Tax=Echinicola rosea TaxID=1807691 RepID=UPI001650ED2D|nr:LTA synthase family protein [Echinicola rosea]
MQITLSIWEVLWIGKTHDINILSQPNILITNVLETIKWTLYTLGIFFLIQVFLGMVIPRLSYFLVKAIFSVLLLTGIGLVMYFSKTLVPLGADVYSYSFSDIKETVMAAGMLNLYTVFGILGALVVIYWMLSLGRYIKIKGKGAWIIPGAAFFVLVVLMVLPINTSKGLTGLSDFLAENKSFFLYQESYDYFASAENIYFDFYLSSTNDENQLFQKEYMDTQYPFLHKNNYPDLLGNYFEPFDSAPNLVFVIVEGLGKAYSGPNAYLGSWTPFLDSLGAHSLYWKNNLSSTGRTFGVLPGLFGGLPFGEHGFMEATPYPKHRTLLSVLKENNYQINYFIGSDKHFDNADTFMQYQGVDMIVDIHNFDGDLKKSPAEANGFSWGYADKENFKNGLRKIPSTDKPQVNIFQTMSSHSPFVIPQQAYYNQKVTSFLEAKQYSHPTISLNKYQKELASIMYVDDAIKDFFTEYEKREDFENTIFIITGDHRLPEIPMSSLIDRFHVPLIIYSEKLKRPKQMAAVTTHFEVPTSLLAYLDNNFGIKSPEKVAWRGYVLDTAQEFRSNIKHALMRNKYQFRDYFNGEYLISDDKAFKISDNMNIDPINEPTLQEKLSTEFQQYKNQDGYVMNNNAIIP